MAHLPIDNSDVPIRLFESDFLEFFTHISPITVLVIWLPVAVLFMLSEILAVHGTQANLVYLPAGFVLGAFLWTFTEYTMHRFVFHFKARNPTEERIFFLFHGVHHAQPQCKTRLVMPPIVSVPLSVVTYGLMNLIFALLLGLPHWVGPVMSGFTVAYLFYDLTHYATHHFAMRHGIWKYLKRYHMQHHYKTPDARYGVSSPIWDIVFKTKPSA